MRRASSRVLRSAGCNPPPHPSTKGPLPRRIADRARNRGAVPSPRPGRRIEGAGREPGDHEETCERARDRVHARAAGGAGGAGGAALCAEAVLDLQRRDARGRRDGKARGLQARDAGKAWARAHPSTKQPNHRTWAGAHEGRRPSSQPTPAVGVPLPHLLPTPPPATAHEAARPLRGVPPGRWAGQDWAVQGRAGPAQHRPAPQSRVFRAPPLDRGCRPGPPLSRDGPGR